MNGGTTNRRAKPRRVRPARPWMAVALKNGWYPFASLWTVNSIGWVSGQGRDYAIAVLTDDDPSEQYGIETISEIASASFATLGS